MLDKKIINIADDKGLTIEENISGFSVKKSGVQIRFFFDEEKLISFLHDYDEEEFQNELKNSKIVEEKKVETKGDRVVTQTIVQVKGVVITDIQMPFGSMVAYMVKWTIASIPAFIILMVLFYVGITLFGGILGYFGR